MENSEKIISTNKTPFNQVEVDSVTVDIIENALKNVREEMDTVLFRTAMSPGIREQGDCFPMVANRDGKMVVGQFGSFIHGFLNGYKGTLEEGDIILTNDPYAVEAAVSHLPDWTVLMPIFRNGRHVAWSAMFGHMSDNGGMVPGSIPIKAESIYQEGIRIPPSKLYKKGELQEELFELILNNVRTPQWNRFDLNALVAACRTAGRRCNEIMERFGDDKFVKTMEMMLDRNKKAMGAIINMAIPEKPFVFEDYLCDDGVGYGPYKVACKVWREGDKCIFDFAGTDAQSNSSVNFYLSEAMFKMFFGSIFINQVDPQIPFNDGFYDLVDVRIPENSLLKPKFPAALSGRTHLIGRIFDVMGGMLGQGAPEMFLNAAGFSDSPHLFFSGYGKDGKWFQLFQIGFGGIPGRPIGDGPDGHSLWPNFTNVPNEFIEAFFPLRIEKYQLIPDSGGAGLHRGGNGLNVVYRFLVDGKIGIHDDRWLTYPWGVLGGEPGKRSEKILVRKNGKKVILGSKCDEVVVKSGDCLHFNTWGGGGWGDPYKRDAKLVLTDVKSGLVTVKGALRYGVVIKGSKIDEKKTTQLRARLSKKRGKAKLFNRGFKNLKELRLRAKKETGLEAPLPPLK